MILEIGNLGQKEKTKQYNNIKKKPYSSLHLKPPGLDTWALMHLSLLLLLHFYVFLNKTLQISKHILPA